MHRHRHTLIHTKSHTHIENHRHKPTQAFSNIQTLTNTKKGEKPLTKKQTHTQKNKAKKLSHTHLNLQSLQPLFLLNSPLTLHAPIDIYTQKHTNTDTNIHTNTKSQTNAITHPH